MLRLNWLVCTVLLVFPGCGGVEAPVEQGGGAVLTEVHPEVVRTPGWLEFRDLSLHSMSEGRAPVQPYVEGQIIGGIFEPMGNVVGVVSEAPPRRITTRGWLHLPTRAFTADAIERPRRPPYVEGLQDRESLSFYPTSDVRTAALTSGPSVP